MIFNGKEHRERFQAYTKKDKTYKGDTERNALFYLLAYIGDRPERFYNFRERCIIPESINRPELTGTTRRALRLAFILFNSFPDGEPDNGINNIFGYNPDAEQYFIEALHLRHNIPYNDPLDLNFDDLELPDPAEIELPDIETFDLSFDEPFFTEKPVINCE